jgi:hypothetical protein
MIACQNGSIASWCSEIIQGITHLTLYSDYSLNTLATALQCIYMNAVKHNSGEDKRFIRTASLCDFILFRVTSRIDSAMSRQIHSLQ